MPTRATNVTVSADTIVLKPSPPDTSGMIRAAHTSSLNDDCLCPFCDSSQTSIVEVASDEFRDRYPMRGCRGCGTRFIWPLPDDRTMARAYATAYYGAGKTKFSGIIERLRDAASSGRARVFVRHLPPKGRALDIGCGDGRLLKQLQRLGSNLEVHGIELPGPAAQRAASIAGLHLHLGTLSTAEYPKESFDLITMVHVIEHLPAPRAALEKVTSWLKPGGRLFLAFPNIASWQAQLFGSAWFHLDPPRHLTFVPPSSIANLLRKQGFTVDRGQHWCPEQNLFGWLQSVLNRIDADRNLLYERLKRNRHYAPNRNLALIWHTVIAALLVPPAVLVDIASAASQSGATVELTFRKST